MREYKIIGLMSGTSLDGLDIAYVTLEEKEAKKWVYKLHEAETIPLPQTLLKFLHAGTEISALQFVNLDHELALFFARCVNQFCEKHQINKNELDGLASHGQTIFHQPQKGFTTQIANGEVIAHHTGIKTIANFRMKDVLSGGQGAPLVPIGDMYLFGEQADVFLNIGGFANISFLKDGLVHAYDVCPGNLPLNKLARTKDLEYDKSGELARKGELSFFLLNLLNNLPYYALPAPKSLGSEWLENEFYPLLKFDKDIENNLATVVEHIADKLAQTLNMLDCKRVMITGGGAKNDFLIERFKRYYQGEIVVVDESLIAYKEAIVFALLGALHLQGDANCLASVTGANADVCGGVTFFP